VLLYYFFFFFVREKDMCLSIRAKAETKRRKDRVKDICQYLQESLLDKSVNDCRVSPTTSFLPLVAYSEYPDGNSEGIRTSYRINFYKTLFLINNYHLVHIKLKDLKEFNLKALLFFPIRLLYTHSDCSAIPF